MASIEIETPSASVCYKGRVEGHLIQQAAALGSRIAAATKYQGDLCVRVLAATRCIRGLERQRRSSVGDDDIDIATVAARRSDENDLHAW